MLDVIKQYMVSIGANIDKKSFAGAEGVIKKLGLVLNVLIGKELFKAIKGMAEFANGVAQADRQMGLLARRMMTTKENARSLNLAMKAMNIKSLDELREIGLDPEAKKQFLELKALARTLENPKYAKTMKEVRALNFEFQKIQVRLEYFKMEIVGKMLDGLKKAKPYIQKLIDFIMPAIKPIQSTLIEAKKTAPIMWSWLQKYTKWVMPIFKIIRGLTIMVINGWKLIFRGIQQMAPAFESSFRVIKRVLDPIMKIFRFIEDLIVYMSGGKSHREKYFDKLPWLKDMRAGATGKIEERTREKVLKKARKGAMANLGTDPVTYRAGERFGAFGFTPVGGRKEERLSRSTQVALARLSRLDPELAQLGLNITSAQSGVHKGRAHGAGLATDIQGSAYAIARAIRAAIQSAQFSKYIVEGSQQQIADTVKELNKLGVNPRAYSTAVYSGNVKPVAHIENKDLQQLLTQTQTSTTASTININVYGDKNPKATVDELQRQLKQEADTGIQ